MYGMHFFFFYGLYGFVRSEFKNVRFCMVKIKIKSKFIEHKII